MRIALDATYMVDPHPSGIAVYSRELLRCLAAAHPEDEFVHCYRPKQFFRAEPMPGFNMRKKMLLPPLPNIRADLFHALNQRIDRRPARRVVSTFHDLFVMTNDYSSRAFRERFTQQARQAAALSDLIIAVSEFTATQVHTLLGVPRSRIRVVHHGVNPPNQERHESREQLVLFVGALQLRKNIARLITAFEQMPPAWRLVLAGAPTGYGVSTILEQIRASPARERIQVTGYLRSDDLEALYARASIFAFPSLDEGFGMPVLDAMARGIPVITSCRSALPEVAGDAALLVDPFHTDEIADALHRLGENESLRDSQVRAGLARVKHFGWDIAANQTYKLYRELLS